MATALLSTPSRGAHPAASPPTDLPERAVFLLRPPYERPDYHASWRSLEAQPTAHGTIAGIRLDPPLPEWTAVERWVLEVQRRLPASPVILLLRAPSEGGLLLSARAARVGVRAVLPEEQPLREPLREALATADTLADDVIAWLHLRGARLSPVVAVMLQQIFALAPLCPDLSTLLARTGTAETSARFRLQKRRLPPPSRWFQTARALHIAIRIQAEPQTCLLRIAHRFGYADHSALSQLVYRAFGVRPGAIRGTLGWEWLLLRWLRSTVRESALRVT